MLFGNENETNLHFLDSRGIFCLCKISQTKRDSQRVKMSRSRKGWPLEAFFHLSTADFKVRRNVFFYFPFAKKIPCEQRFLSGIALSSGFHVSNVVGLFTPPTTRQPSSQMSSANAIKGLAGNKRESVEKLFYSIVLTSLNWESFISSIIEYVLQGTISIYHVYVRWKNHKS